MSLERSGGVWVKAYPLLLRGGLIEEVAKITGLQRKQVENLRNHLRKRGGLKRPTKEEERQAKRRAHLGKPAQGERVYTSHQEKSSFLAREFLEAGFLTEDLSSWEELHKLYGRYQRPLPQDFSDQLRLEVFLRARVGVERGDVKSLAWYGDLGNKVDARWFESILMGEEEFIILAKERELLGYGEDERGFFRATPDGEKLRPIEVVDGSLVVVNTELALKKQRARESP